VNQQVDLIFRECKLSSAFMLVLGSNASYPAFPCGYSADRMAVVNLPQEIQVRPAGLDSPALLAAASAAGHPVTDRMLAALRAQGLVPRPRRAGYQGRAPVWLYPAWADRQFVALLRYRAQTTDPDLLRVLLWLDGFSIPTGDVRRVLAAHLRQMTEAIEQAITIEAGQRGLDPADDAARSQAVSGLAGTMAAKRGTSALPRHGRTPARDRAEAVELLVRSIGLGEHVAGTPDQGEAVERVLGVSPGRRRSPVSGQPWLTGPAEEIFGAVGIASMPRLREAIADASDAELEAARQSVIALVRILPLAARMMDVLSGRDNSVGLKGLEQVAERPEAALWLLPAVVSMTRVGMNENIGAITEALQPIPKLAERARALLDMPAATLEGNLENQPENVRRQVERIIDAAIDGQFD
jgi:hypothetical protein